MPQLAALVAALFGQHNDNVVLSGLYLQVCRSAEAPRRTAASLAPRKPTCVCWLRRPTRLQIVDEYNNGDVKRWSDAMRPHVKQLSKQLVGNMRCTDDGVLPTAAIKVLTLLVVTLPKAFHADDLLEQVRVARPRG